MTPAPVQHIEIDGKGIPRIAGSRSRVSQIVVDHCKLTPAEIVEAYPHLTLADVYAALAYYHDHREQIDAEIQEANRFYEEGLAKQRSDPNFQLLAQKMKDRAGKQ